MSTATRRASTPAGFVAGLILMLAAPGPAKSHQSWADGTPVPGWVGKACCGPADAHHLSPAEVHRVDAGYRIDGYPRVVYDAQVLPSEDGEYWAFYRESTASDGEKVFTSVFCFFAPSWG